jgi:hypothetical protein
MQVKIISFVIYKILKISSITIKYYMYQLNQNLNIGSKSKIYLNNFGPYLTIKKINWLTNSKKDWLLRYII